MQLVEGEYYRTADGRKVGPLSRRDDTTHPFMTVSELREVARVATELAGFLDAK